MDNQIFGNFENDNKTGYIKDLKNEILAPASTFETVCAAVNAGADAIYIGGEKFGARAYADNQNQDELNRIIDYCHIFGKKVYLTVNTLLKNPEIKDQLYEYLLPYYENGLDAVIVQDLGVFDLIKNTFPDMDIHCSTQMMITGVDSAKMLKKMGATRIVTARELSLKELKEIHDNVDIEIESFIHGAMCYSYSGACLFSSMLGGRSGNRGRCAGPCRQNYQVFEDNKRINDKNSQYALSLRDMNTLEILPEIIESGVYSLKIEGRMKSPQYCAGVVSIYRKYLDLYYENGIDKYNIDKRDYENLYNLYSRSGSLTGYYKCHNGKNMITKEKPAYKSGNPDFIDYIDRKYCKEANKLLVNAEVNVKTGDNINLKILDKNNSVIGNVYGDVVEPAQKKAATQEDIRKQINKTGDTFFEFNNIDINIQGDNFIPVSKLNELRRKGLEEFSKKLLENSKRKADKNLFYKYTEKLYDKKLNTEELITAGKDKAEKSENNLNVKKIILQISDLEQLRTALNFENSNEIIDEIYIACDRMSIEEVLKALALVRESNYSLNIVMPYVFRRKAVEYINKLLTEIANKKITNAGNSLKDVNFIVRNVDELGFVLDNKLSFSVDSGLYAFNDFSKKFLYKLGARHVAMPLELNYKELKNFAEDSDELVVYGKAPLMISANCIKKSYSKCDNKTGTNHFIKDRMNADFSIANCCEFCYNIIYNNLPNSLLAVNKKVNTLDCERLRINLSDEDKKNTREIIDKFARAYKQNSEAEEFEKYTRGHFNRGIE